MTLTKHFFLDQHGCAKNQVDGELLIGILTERGWEKIAEPEAADLIIVNSCGFIEPAKRESIEAVITARAAYPKAKILLAGCLAERYGEVFRTELEEADAFFGNGDLSQLPLIIDSLFPPEASGSTKGLRSHLCPSPTVRPFLKPAQEGVCCGARPELLNFPRSAFIKITEGCNNCCSFCAIPLIRGAVRSRPLTAIVSEIEQFVQRGYKEFNLIGQDLAVYDAAPQAVRSLLKMPYSPPAAANALDISLSNGMQLSVNTKQQIDISLSDKMRSPPCVQPSTYTAVRVTMADARQPIQPVQKTLPVHERQKQSGLAQLLQAISGIKGQFSVRLLYIHPDHFPLDILPIMTADTRFLPYFDIPFQSGSDPIIHAMNRCGSAEIYLNLIKNIRAAFREAQSPYGEPVIRTTFLTGFPGETQADFECTVQFLQSVQSLWSGTFVYSQEEGTKAASFKKKVPAKIAEERKSILGAVQLKITEQKLASFCGQELDVLVEEIILPDHTGETPTREAANRVADGCIALARAWFQAPEVDGAVVVHFSKDQQDSEGKPITAGSVLRVRITALRGIDLEAEALGLS